VISRCLLKLKMFQSSSIGKDQVEMEPVEVGDNRHETTSENEHSQEEDLFGQVISSSELIKLM
jgi:hypothetical protein